MESDILFAQRFNTIPSEYTKASPQFRIDRIFNHYLLKVQSGMNVNHAIERSTRDICGDNYHPTKTQRSGINNIKQED